ncbi:MAG: exodeoxyribonuclease VII large subunit [SAR324 cluster bacterium]|nr:exodeoxyribonuclease VII large subunit [SAR324 cluster bacterium]
MPSVIFEVEIPPMDETSKKIEPIQQNDSVAQESPKIWTVSKLTRHIRLTLESQFRSLILEGELSNFKRSTPGHLYFQIKDNQAQIRGVMFRQAARFLKFEPSDGLEVIIKGHISVYEPRGDYQIQVSSMEPKGLGSLQLAFEQLKEKLEQEGLFHSDHKQTIPFFPRRIGIVTSPTGAVIHDMLHVLKRRCPIVPVLLYPAAVQGDQASPKLIEAIQYFNQIRESHQIDVIIIGRGGGSIEDLWAFNNEELVRTIFHSEIPVISAVGHETDFTLADFASDLRAPTPSAAMELAVPEIQDLTASLKDRETRLLTAIRRHIQQHQANIVMTTQRLRSPDFIIHQHMQRLDDLSHRLQIFMQNKLLQSKDQLTQKIELLNSLNPLAVIKRGYGLILNDSQKMVQSIHTVQEDDALIIHLSDGKLKTRIEKKLPK